LLAAGHEVHTAREEGLAGKPDPDLLAVASREGRCLLTLDLDFANVLAYPPESHGGIVVFRLPSVSLQGLLQLMISFAVWLEEEDPSGQLWIAEPGRLRIYTP
jgi:predicted nuclease of predicted toxin-antitoxin system